MPKRKDAPQSMVKQSKRKTPLWGFDKREWQRSPSYSKDYKSKGSVFSEAPWLQKPKVYGRPGPLQKAWPGPRVPSKPPLAPGRSREEGPLIPGPSDSTVQKHASITNKAWNGSWKGRA